MILPTIVEWSHWIIRRVLRAGDAALDATVGNGHDLVMMASCVAPNGLVIGCDVQHAALDRARRHAQEQHLGHLVRLYNQSHEYIDRICVNEGINTVQAIMYNLGYLPGGDKAIRTQVQTTLASLEKARSFLAPGGVMTIVCYRGHGGGEDETEAVRAWCLALPPEQYECSLYAPLHSAAAPIGLAVARRSTRQ